MAGETPGYRLLEKGEVVDYFTLTILE